jgi:hypothetical protein
LNLNNSNSSIQYANITSPASTQYTYNLWVFVNTWNNTTTKTLFQRGSDFKLYLGDTSPTLNCYIASSTSTPNSAIQITDNFPVQKWVFVTVSVNNQIVDFYLDGKLVKSNKLPQFPSISSSDITFGIFDAFISLFTRVPKAADPLTVWNSYMGGNGTSSSFSAYGLKMGILKDEVLQGSYRLF